MVNTPIESITLKSFIIIHINTVHAEGNGCCPVKTLFSIDKNVNLRGTNDGRLMLSLTINSCSISPHRRLCTIYYHVTTTCFSAYLHFHTFMKGWRFDSRSVMTSLTFMRSSLVKLPSPKLGQLCLWSLSEPAPSACSELSCFHFWWRQPAERHSKHKTSQICKKEKEKRDCKWEFACEPSPRLGASLPPSGRCCAAVQCH